jgi:hypothetical protein
MDELDKRLNAIEKRLSKIEADLERVEKTSREYAETTESTQKLAEAALEQAKTVLEMANTDGHSAGRAAAKPEEILEPIFRLGEGGIHMESKIGGQGLALLGNLVLLLGIVFLTQWVINLGHSIIGNLIGYACTAVLFGLSRYPGRSNPFLGRLFQVNAFLLLFLVTLRLHYFSSSPIIPNEGIALIVLIAVVTAELVISIRNRSELFTTMAILLVSITAIISNRTHVMLPLVTAAGVLSTILLYRLHWRPLFVITLLLVYLTFILWFFNNPIMGNPLEARNTHHMGYLYLLVCGSVFALVPLMKLPVKFQPGLPVVALWLNSLGFTFILLLLVLQFFSENYTYIFLLVTVLCLGYSIFLQVRKEWKFGSAFYSLYGFLALSIAIYGIAHFPDTFLFLALESLLVVSMALWFRNRLIVIMNGVLFMFLLVAYFVSKDHTDPVNFTYALIPLATARILNWKKERLEIRTEMLRNLYLILGFAAVLYAVYNAVPSTYVTLAWTITAVIFFAFSFVIRNVKYRIMAIGTVIAGAFHLFLVDLSRVEVAFRVLAFLFLAIISIGVSIYYSRQHRKQSE